ncbi:Hypothetical protein AA314_03143 [Archangium gephyra]|nr:Hypothetical protein AA314_03143 [Archangium gephyra]
MLVAQYLIETESGEKCRERIFVMEGAKFIPITATSDQCGSW